MHIVVLVAQKGGVGKTSLTINLAVRAALAGKRVAIVDADPQESASNWSMDRHTKAGLEEPGVAPAVDIPTLLAAVKAARDDQLDYCFIDTPAGAQQMLMPTEATRLADIVLIPCAPSSMDMKAMTPTIKMVRRLQKPGWFLINKGRSRGINNDCALQLTSTFGLPAVHAHISDWKPLVDAAADGKTVVELPPSRKQPGIDQAKAEFDALWTWLDNQLSLPPTAAPELADAPELRS